MSGEASKNLPRRLGRYDVLYPFATSRHSSLLVARLDEPGTAPLPVMIRRIDPTLIQGKDVETFLAKARRSVGAAHPNVVHVKEVAAADDEVFLVMEHVEGESVAALLKRLEVEQTTLDYALAAYIVAEAAAALDAVHDAGMVYEHLTPHEIFVGYDGRVKVFDVGLGAALATLTTTKSKSIDETELPYSSPERCKGDPPHQRSDVFSLGSILWHLMSGVSPFEHLSELDTVRAILSADPLVPPATLRNIPTALSEIALRAVARERAKRYPTTRALRQELRTFLRGAPNGATVTTSLGELMSKLFAEEVREHSAALGRLDVISDAPPSTISTIPPMPNRHADEQTVERLTVEVTPPIGLPMQNELVAETVSEELDQQDLFEAESTHEPPIALPGQRGRTPFVVGGLLVLGVLVFLLFGRGSTAGPGTSASMPPTVKDAPKGPALPASTPTPPQERMPDPVPAVAAQAETTISIDTLPSKSTVTVAGKAFGQTPLELKLPKGQEAVVVEIRHAGYQTLREEVRPDVDQRLKLTLSPLAVNPSAAPRPTATGSANPYHRFD